jgi:hypothetical protein
VIDFFWTSGHLGWGVFTLAAFTMLWILVLDVLWRVTRIRFVRLLAAMCVAWVSAGVVIVLVAGINAS